MAHLYTCDRSKNTNDYVNFFNQRKIKTFTNMQPSTNSFSIWNQKYKCTQIQIEKYILTCTLKYANEYK